MKILQYSNNRLKFCGITIFKIRRTKISILGIPVFGCNPKIANLEKKIRNNKDFDMRNFDNEIKKIVSNDEYFNINLNSNKIAFLASILYDMGGHSKCIRDLIKSLQEHYKQKLFLTQQSESLNAAPKTILEIAKYAAIEGVDSNLINLNNSAKKMAKSIIDFAPKVLLVYIHPNDIFGTAVVSLIKQTTNIRVIFFNHASHIPNLAMSFADIILEGLPSAEKITNEKRGLLNTKVIGLQSLAKEETKYFSEKDISKLKTDFDIPYNYFITMSGAGGYKFFDGNNSQYFRMIKRLLEKEANLIHVVISKFNKRQKLIINNIFADKKDIKKRLLIIPYQTDFDKWFQMSDVFIDSFPLSSALTQIDLMRNKVASVVKINPETPEFSFHEYQMPDYPYMFKDIQDMENAILELLYNEKKRTDIVNKNYTYWLKTYERNVVKDKYIKIIEGI